MNLVITLRLALDELCKIQHSCFCPGWEIVANLFLHGIDKLGVAAEGVSHIVHGFLVMEPHPYTPAETRPLRFSGRVISTWTRIE